MSDEFKRWLERKREVLGERETDARLLTQAIRDGEVVPIGPYEGPAYATLSRIGLPYMDHDSGGWALGLYWIGGRPDVQKQLPGAWVAFGDDPRRDDGAPCMFVRFMNGVGQDVIDRVHELAGTAEKRQKKLEELQRAGRGRGRHRRRA